MNINEIKIGIIGFGNMGQAMAKGWIQSNKISPKQILTSARNFDRLKSNSEAIGAVPYDDLNQLLVESDIVVLAVKPHQIAPVVEPLKEQLSTKIILSVAAGINYTDYQSILCEKTAHISLIPNTPVSIGEGITIAESKHSLTEEQLILVTDLLALLGLVEFVDTEKLSIAGTLAGCGPAFASMFIEALADGAVKYGLSRQEAYRLASQMIVGTGKMQLESGEHPGKMKDAVASPGGTTIKGITELEQQGFRGAVISAFDAIEG